MMAEESIQAATKSGRTRPTFHYLDVLGEATLSIILNWLTRLLRKRPDIIAWLEDPRCMLSKYPDGRLKTMHGRGTCRKRMHYAADITAQRSCAQSGRKPAIARIPFRSSSSVRRWILS